MLRTFAIFLFAASILVACKPNDETPPDPIKPQRQAMDKAKALESQMQQDSQQQMRQADDQSK